MQTAIALFLIVIGLGMILFWLQHILRGGLNQGLKTIDAERYIAPHIAAEVLTGLLCIAGGAGLLTGSSWAPPVALLGCGMLAYTGLCSLDWALMRSKALSAIFVVAFVGAILVFVYLLWLSL